MRVRGVVGIALFFVAVAAGAEAGLPKPVRLVNRVETCASRGAYGVRAGKYNKASWGNRWKQSLGRATVGLAPYVARY